MLARQYSLKGIESYQDVQKKGKLFQFECFGVSVLRRKDRENSLFGFTVSKKIDNLATHRNRIKRAMSEAVRHDLVNIKKGYSIVFLAKPACARKSTDELMRGVKEALLKAEVSS